MEDQNNTTGANGEETLNGHASTESTPPVDPATAGSQTHVGTGNNEVSPNQNITAKMSQSQRKKLKKWQKAQQKQLQDYLEFSRNAIRKQTTKFKELKKTVGNDVYKNLKKACTVTIPEVKNENGEVVQPETTRLDTVKFMKELHLAVVVLRQDRINRGIRKKTTGRTSNRRHQSIAIKAILKRAEEIKAKETVTPLNGSEA